LAAPRRAARLFGRAARSRARARAHPARARRAGTVAVAVFVTAGLCALLAGVLGDALPRRPLLFFFVLLSEAACLGTAWVRNFNQLLALRGVAGIALGCVPPLVYSAVADIFPASRRNVAASFVTVATSAGVVVGNLIAGYVGATRGWRTPFIVVSVPCLLIALLMPLIAREPARGASELTLRLRIAAAAAAREASSRSGGANGERSARSGEDDDAEAGAAGEKTTSAADVTAADVSLAPPPAPPPAEFVYAERLEVRKLAAVFAVPTNVVIFLQCIPSCVPWGVLNTFLADFLAQDRKLGVKVTTSALLVYAAGALLGALGGAALTQHLFNTRPRYVGLVVAAATAGGIGPLLYIVRSDGFGPGRFGPLGGAAFGAGVLTCVAAPAMRTAVLNVNPPETRGSAFSIYVFLDSLGKGLGPLAAASLTVRDGRRSAFTTCVSLWAVSAGLQSLLMFTLRADEAALQRRLRTAKLKGVQDDASGGGGSAEEMVGMPVRTESTTLLLCDEEQARISSGGKGNGNGNGAAAA
jgi:predicted MFS family arabinose efflux permease